MRSLLQGEHRRAVIMGAVGLAATCALLVFRLFAGGGDDDLGASLDAALSATPAIPVGAPAPTAPPSPPSPVDPALLRDPFCPLVAASAAPETPPVVCRRSPAPQGRQAVGLEDIFVEAGRRLARMHVGSVTFPNLHEGETFAELLRVVSLTDRCGEFEHAGGRFQLCEGEEVFR
ncbi:MAG: hypothetical protein ACRD0C_04430 [Acidimicrobiia bacterium]